MTASTRERMIKSAIHLFRRQGYSGTGFREVIAHSGTPRGSIYHHFPGGKAELGVEAVRSAGEASDRLLGQLVDARDPAAGVDAYLSWWARYLESSDFRAGCPIVAVAGETHPDAPELGRAAGEVFARWETTLAAAFRRAGMARGRARSIASLVIAAFEGATVMARARRDTRPLYEARREIRRLIEDALPA
jgi:AcrR family transcriptional regulator